MIGPNELRRKRKYAKTKEVRVRRSRLEPLERRDLLTAIVWASGPRLPEARTDGVAILAPNNVVHLLGGDTAVAAASTTTPTLGATATDWTFGKDIDRTRNHLGAAQGSGGIYLVGGTDGDEGSDEVLNYAYSLLADSEDVSQMNNVRYDHAVAADESGRVYALGGIGVLEDEELWSHAERYTPSTDTWASISPLPTPLRGMSAVGDGNGHIFVFGGSSTLDNLGIRNSVLQYDVASNSWSHVAPMPVPTRDSAIAVDEDGLMYVLGGISASGPTDTVQVYDPAFNSWTTQTPLPEPLYSHAAVYDSLGRIMVAGGFDATGTATDAVYRTQRLNIPDAAPVITSSANLTASTDTTYSYDVDATGNPEPTYTLAANPAGMTIDATTGLISWQPVAGQEGTQGVTVRASNAIGFDEQSFEIIVAGDTLPPTVPADFTFDSATETTVTLSWSPSTDPSGIDHYEVYSAVYSGPRFAKRWRYTLEESVTTTTATITGLAPFTSKRFSVAAVDTVGNRSAYSPRILATTVSVPTLSFQYGTQTTGLISSPALHLFELQLISRANPLAAFSLVSGPATMTVDPGSGNVRWTPTVADIGLHTLTLRASNSVGHTDLIVELEVLADTPQLSVALNPTSGGAGFALAGEAFEAQVSDASMTTSTFELMIGPSGMTIDPTTGLISWTPIGSQGGINPVVVRATNAGGTADLSFNVPTLFTGAVTNVTATGTNLLEPTLQWEKPTGEGSLLIDSYRIEGLARWRHGRSNRSHRVSYTVPASETNVLMTGMLTGRQYAMTVTPIDAHGNLGLANADAHVVSSPALPQLRWTVNGATGGSGEVIAGYPMQIALTDQQTGDSTIELISGPSGMTFDSETNIASWTPGAADVTTGYSTTPVTFRATNAIGSADTVVPIRVFFSGPATNVSTTRVGYSATASWDAPSDNITPIAGYSITRHWTWSGRRRSVTWTVGNVTSIAFPLYPTGAVSHKGITVTPLDANGNRGVSSGLLRYNAPPNDNVPVAVDDSYAATEDVTLVMDVAGGVQNNDSDADNNPLTTRVVSPPTHGSVTLNTSGSFTYTPNQDFNGIDSFTYHANDGRFTSNTATVTINVAATNDAPVALFDYYSGEEAITLTVDPIHGVLPNDRDTDGDPLTASLATPPANGTVNLHTDGSFDYTPDLEFVGVDSFQYVADDGTANSNLATVYIAVDVPFALNDSYTTAAGVPLVVNVASRGVIYHETFEVQDSPSPLSAAGWSIVTGTDNPTVQSADFVEEDNLNVNKITVNDESGVGFTSSHVFLEHDINEPIMAGQVFGETFVYTDEIVADNGGDPLDLNGSHVFVDHANGDGTHRGPGFQFALRSGDNWFVAEQMHNVTDAVQSVETVSLPISTATMFVPIQVSPNEVNPDARILYQETLTRPLTAAELGNVTAAGILTYPQTDGLPARFDNFAITTSTMPPSTVAGVLDNDDDPNPAAAPLVAVLVDAPTNGSVVLNADGSFSYTPGASFIGRDQFTYQASNGVHSSNLATATIDVTGVVPIPPPAVERVEINDGEAQRSNITSVTVTFDGLVEVNDNAFALVNLGLSAAPQNVPVTNILVDTEDVSGKTIATLTFDSGPGISDRGLGNSLADGRYQLTIDASQVTSDIGGEMAADYTFGATAADNFFRLYGDNNGDGSVNFNDFSSGFLPAFGASLGETSYDIDLDADGDGSINFSDFANGFLQNFGKAR